MSPRHRQIIHSVLSKALEYATARRQIEINPIKLTPRPRAAKSEIQALTPQQATAFLDAAKGKPHEALFVVAVTTALRQGELFGLQWGDVDLEAGTIMVRRTLQRIHGKIHKALIAHKPKTVAPDQLVFTTNDGGPLRKENVVRRYFQKRLQDAGLPTITFHAVGRRNSWPA